MTASGGAKRFYPVFLDLEGRLVVIVGGGAAAEKKARQLVRYGADVTVIATDTTTALHQSEAEGNLTVEHRGYVRGDLAGATLVCCVSTDPEVQRAVHAEALSVGCLVNTLDNPELCSFLVPGVVNREPLQIAVSTGGASPEVAKQVRRALTDEYGPEWSLYTQLVAQVRGIARERCGDSAQCAAVIAAVATPELRARLAAGERPDPQSLFDEVASDLLVDEEE